MSIVKKDDREVVNENNNIFDMYFIFNINNIDVNINNIKVNNIKNLGLS